MTTMTHELTLDTVLGNIDVNHPFFDQGVESGVRVQFPGDAPEATCSPKQARFMINGFLQRATTDNGYLTSTLGVVHAAERRAERVTAAQWSALSLIQVYTQEANAPYVDDPITEGQARIVQTNLSALAGTENHWDVTTQRNISALSEKRTEQFIDMWMDVSTRGEFQIALGKFNAIVGNPAARSRTNPAMDTVNDLLGGEDEEVDTSTNGDEDPM